MDGWEATRQIRNWEVENCDICRKTNVAWCRHNRLPIVAVTADAMKGTHAECFSSGMDDYITKVSRPTFNHLGCCKEGESKTLERRNIVHIFKSPTHVLKVASVVLSLSTFLHSLAVEQCWRASYNEWADTLCFAFDSLWTRSCCNRCWSVSLRRKW